MNDTYYPIQSFFIEHLKQGMRVIAAVKWLDGFVGEIVANKEGALYLSGDRFPTGVIVNHSDAPNYLMLHAEDIMSLEIETFEPSLFLERFKECSKKPGTPSKRYWLYFEDGSRASKVSLHSFDQAISYAAEFAKNNMRPVKVMQEVAIAGIDVTTTVTKY